jgi:Ca2+/Na+ antiporter
MINYIKRLLYKLFVYLNNRLSIFEKIIYFILVTSLIVVTLISWFQTYPYYFALGIGFVLFLTGIYLFVIRDIGKQQQVINRKARKNYDKNDNNVRNISTNGGNYNESIHGNNIQGDYINIQNHPIDISEDFTQIIEKLQNILTTLISQGSSVEEAVNKMANDLAKESRTHPEIKSKFLLDDYTSDSDFKQEFLDLLINYYLSTDKSQFSPNYQYTDNSKDYQDTINYQGHTIHLRTDKDNVWHYKIDGIIYDNTGESYFKHMAIYEAKGKIDDEIFRNW